MTRKRNGGSGQDAATEQGDEASLLDKRQLNRPEHEAWRNSQVQVGQGAETALKIGSGL
jgi:hypothetical protein